MSNRALFASLRKRLQQLPQNIQTAHGLAVFREAVRNTPVFRPHPLDPDWYPKVVGGTARAGWQITFDSPVPIDESIDPDTAPKDENGDPTINKGLSVLLGVPGPRVVWISNPVPWIVDLEYGTYPYPNKAPVKRVVRGGLSGRSSQAPHGIVRIALEYGRRNLDSIARAQFQRLFGPGRAA